MNNDGFSYPLDSHIENGKTIYRYSCDYCQAICDGYYFKRVKGHIRCSKCRSDYNDSHKHKVIKEFLADINEVEIQSHIGTGTEVSWLLNWKAALLHRLEGRINDRD